MNEIIERKLGTAFAENLQKRYKPQDISAWENSTPVELLQAVRNDIFDGVASVGLFIEEKLIKQLNANQITPFDLSPNFKFLQVCNAVVMEAELIRCTVRATASYLLIYLKVDRDDPVWKASPAAVDLLKETASIVETANARLKRWVVEILAVPEIKKEHGFNVSKNITLEDAMESILAGTYVIDLVTDTIKLYCQAYMEGRIGNIPS